MLTLFAVKNVRWFTRKFYFVACIKPLASGAKTLACPKTFDPDLRKVKVTKDNPQKCGFTEYFVYLADHDLEFENKIINA